MLTLGGVGEADNQSHIYAKYLDSSYVWWNHSGIKGQANNDAKIYVERFTTVHNLFVLRSYTMHE